jgi:anti-sigma B factor antagonist
VDDYDRSIPEGHGNAMAESKDINTVVPSIRHVGNAVVATLRGEIDLHNSPTVRAALLKFLDENKPAKLVLNLAAVPYMDSSAIAVLVEALQRMRKTGGKIYLTNLQPRVKGLLEIARLDSIFIVVANEEDALKT